MSAATPRSSLMTNLVACAAAVVVGTSVTGAVVLAAGFVAFAALAWLTWRVACGDWLQWLTLPVTACLVGGLSTAGGLAPSGVSGNLIFLLVAIPFGVAVASVYLAERPPALVLALGLVTGVVGMFAFGFAALHRPLISLYFGFSQIVNTGAANQAIALAQAVVLAVWDSLLIGIVFALVGLVVCLPVAIWLDRR